MACPKNLGCVHCTPRGRGNKSLFTAVEYNKQCIWAFSAFHVGPFLHFSVPPVGLKTSADKLTAAIKLMMN